MSPSDVLGPFNPRRAISPDTPPPPPASRESRPARRGSPALLVTCPACMAFRGDWCKPSVEVPTRNVHRERSALAGVAGPFNPETAMRAD